MLSFYSRLLDRFPIPTKTITSGILFSLGDVVTQLCTIDINHRCLKKQSFDWKRNLMLATMGAAYIAPALHVWYCRILPRVRENLFKGWSKTGSVIGSMALDQLVFAPVLLYGFFIVHSSLQGDPQKGMQLANNKIWQTLKSNWKIWIPATTINFWLMPLKYQVLFANFVGFFWNIILSYITYK